MKYLLVLLLALPQVVSAQLHGQPLIDSLAKALSSAKADSNKVILLNRLGYMYQRVAPDTGLIYSNQALELAQQLKWSKGIASAYNTLGVNYEAKGNFTMALATYNEALKMFKDLRLRENVASATGNIANLYACQGDNAKALTYYFEALRIVEAIEDHGRIAMIRDNIGSLYLGEKDYEKANSYYEAALSLYREAGDQLNIARTQANIGHVLNATRKHKDALSYFLAALKKHKELGNKRSQANVFAGIGETYDNLGDYQQALSYKQSALELNQHLQDEYGIAICTGNLGITWFKMAGNNASQLHKAIHYLTKGMEQCRKTGSVPHLIEYGQYLSKAYFLTGQHRKAYEVTAGYLAIRDSVYTAESRIQIARLETGRALALKDKDLQVQKNALKLKELDLAKRRGDQVVYTISLLLLLVVTSIAVMMFLNYKKANQTLEKEKNEGVILLHHHEEGLQKQRRLLHETSHMQSHEVRGAIATILGLSQLLNTDNYSDPDNETVVEGIKSVAHELDGIVQDMIKKENNLVK